MAASMTQSLDAVAFQPARQKYTEGTRFYTIAEVAELAGVSTRTVRRWIKNKQLVAHHFGAAVRIAESDLKAYFARHRQP